MKMKKKLVKYSFVLVLVLASCYILNGLIGLVLHFVYSDGTMGEEYAQRYIGAIGVFYYYQDRLPSNEEGLDILTENTSNDPKWGGPYLSVSNTADAKLLDPWGSEYRYECHVDSFIISSSGKDKIIGTSDDIIIATPVSSIRKKNQTNALTRVEFGIGAVPAKALRIKKGE